MKNTNTLIFVVALLTLISCDESSDTAVWNENSAELQLHCGKDAAWGPESTAQAQEYNAVRSELSEASLLVLSELEEIEEGLYCMNDGYANSLTIISDSGDEIVYRSDNTDCGRAKPDGYLSLEKLDELCASFE